MVSNKRQGSEVTPSDMRIPSLTHDLIFLIIRMADGGKYMHSVRLKKCMIENVREAYHLRCRWHQDMEKFIIRKSSAWFTTNLDDHITNLNDHVSRAQYNWDTILQTDFSHMVTLVGSDYEVYYRGLFQQFYSESYDICKWPDGTGLGGGSSGGRNI